MKEITFWLISLFQKKTKRKPEPEKTKEWVVSFKTNGINHNRVLSGEDEDSVRNKFMSVRPNALITSIKPLI